MDKKQESKSGTPEQKQLLIDSVHEHPKLCCKKHGPSFTMKNAQVLWKSITSRLNETVGSKKTGVEWKKVIKDIINYV